MTDLISRLRDWCRIDDSLGSRDLRLWREAADEIEHQQLCIRDLNGILNEKRAEIERLRADAERYRWLEEHCTSENDNGDKCLVFWCDFENYNDVDAAIDAARAALKETP